MTPRQSEHAGMTAGARVCVHMHERASLLVVLPLILGIGFDLFAMFWSWYQKSSFNHKLFYYKKGCCFLLQLAIVQQKLGLLQLSFGMKSIFLFRCLSMWHTLATGKSALNMLEWWTHALVFQWFAREEQALGGCCPWSPEWIIWGRPELMPKPSKPTTWSRVVHCSWARVSPAEVVLNSRASVYYCEALSVEYFAIMVVKIVLQL